MGCGQTKGAASSPENVKKSGSGSKSSKADGKKDLNISTAELVLERTEKITKEYTMLNPALGKGAFGEVRKAVHKASGISRAIKIISRTHSPKEDQERMINEVDILKKLDHPNIIKIFEFYQDDRFFYIVTELCTGGELFDKIISEKSFSERKAADIFKQVLSAVFYCHEHKVVHRDLKPENVLFETEKGNSIVKVIDFGTSRVFDPNEKMTQKFGTPYYIAPEVLRRKYNEKCDLWSLGVILFITLCGYPPFNGANDRIIMEKVSRGIYSFEGPEWNQVSSEAKNFIRKLLEFDAEKRISASEAMNDPWLKKYTNKGEVDIPLMSSALTNMRNFRAGRKLQEATFVFLVNYFATKEEKNELLKTFQALDLNGDGQLSRDELIAGYKKILDVVKAQEEVDAIMAAIDKNNSGSIDYTEFVMATINREKLLSKQRLEAAFKMFDKDGSGSVSIKELKDVFGAANLSDTTWSEIIKEVDDNGDGEISYKEFKEMMVKLSDHHN